MKKKKYLKIMIALFVVVIIVAVIVGVVVYNNHNINNGLANPSNTPGYAENTSTPEPQKETIGNILSTGKASTRGFCNGYGIVTYENVTYIINTKGEICSSFHKTAEWGDILYSASNWNFHEDIAIFISKHGTISFPVEYKNNAKKYWYKSDKSQVLTVTDENLLIVIETTQTIDGAITKIGIQDYLGNWVTEAQETCIESLHTGDGEDYYTTNLGDGIYLIEIRDHYSNSITYHLEHSYLYDINSGVVTDLEKKIPKTPVYYNENFSYDITTISPLREGIQVIFVQNVDGALFAVAIDENGKQLYNPIQVSYDNYEAVYSNGILALVIKENNVEYLLYVDKAGQEVCKIPYNHNSLEQSLYNSGIVTNGNHYYDSTGKLLFE